LPGAKLHQIKVGKGFGRVKWKRLANCYDWKMKKSTNKTVKSVQELKILRGT
jgi:hypothetical protein